MSDLTWTAKLLGVCILVSLGAGLFEFAMTPGWDTAERVVSWGLAGLMFMAWGAAEEEAAILRTILHKQLEEMEDD